jgi:hypothetical protein
MNLCPVTRNDGSGFKLPESVDTVTVLFPGSVYNTDSSLYTHADLYTIFMIPVLDFRGQSSVQNTTSPSGLSHIKPKLYTLDSP